jgi:hypothetical protein
VSQVWCGVSGVGWCLRCGVVFQVWGGVSGVGWCLRCGVVPQSNTQYGGNIIRVLRDTRVMFPSFSNLLISSGIKHRTVYIKNVQIL